MLKPLEERGIVKIQVDRLSRDPVKDYEREKTRISLNEEQLAAVNKVICDYDSGVRGTYLLYGITGSGKTEVYMELIERTIAEGKQAIVLIPEISLTYQNIGRFRRRFGRRVSVMNSKMSEGERYDQYVQAKNGEIDILIGPRSALFAPFRCLGLIIIDEEHSQSYKQESHPKYNAIDVAIERSKYHNAKVILGSATPSLETYARAKKGVYQLLSLENRVNGKSLPKVNIIDMNKGIRSSKGHFSLELLDAINKRISNGEQIILLLNRRGYSSFVTCRSCGYTYKCPNCDITLTYHKSSNTLRCHYCGYGDSLKDSCPSCHEKSLNNLGVGTQKIEEELQEIKDVFDYIRSKDPDLLGKIGGQVKSETGEDATIEEIIALRSKVYCYKTTDGHIGKRAKGTTHDAQEMQLDWDTYKKALETLTSIETRNVQFVRKVFKISSVDVYRQSLSVNDGKRYICQDGIHTHAFGYPLTSEDA